MKLDIQQYLKQVQTTKCQYNQHNQKYYHSTRMNINYSRRPISLTAILNQTVLYQSGKKSFTENVAESDLYFTRQKIQYIYELPFGISTTQNVSRSTIIFEIQNKQIQTNTRAMRIRLTTINRANNSNVPKYYKP